MTWTRKTWYSLSWVSELSRHCNVPAWNKAVVCGPEANLTKQRRIDKELPVDWCELTAARCVSYVAGDQLTPVEIPPRGELD